jgi:hypothetical protein
MFNKLMVLIALLLSSFGHAQRATYEVSAPKPKPALQVAVMATRGLDSWTGGESVDDLALARAMRAALETQLLSSNRIVARDNVVSADLLSVLFEEDGRWSGTTRGGQSADYVIAVLLDPSTGEERQGRSLEIGGNEVRLSADRVDVTVQATVRIVRVSDGEIVGGSITAPIRLSWQTSQDLGVVVNSGDRLGRLLGLCAAAYGETRTVSGRLPSKTAVAVQKLAAQISGRVKALPPMPQRAFSSGALTGNEVTLVAGDRAKYRDWLAKNPVGAKVRVTLVDADQNLSYALGKVVFTDDQGVTVRLFGELTQDYRVKVD